MHRGRHWSSLGFVAALLFGIFVPYFALDREVRSLDAPTRKALGGTYVSLPDGVTHYELTGPEDGPVVVLIHGGTIPMFTWDAQVPALRAAGFRVLRYDHFGRGLSDRPEFDYDRALYQRQLEDLLTALRIKDPVHLVGLSFGGATAATFAAAHPEQVGSLALIAPVLDYAEGKPLFGMARVPGLGEWYARVFSVRGTVARANTFFKESDANPSYAERFDEQTRFEGYEQSLLSMSRTDALTGYHEAYTALNRQPTLLLSGSADLEIPRSHIDYLRETLGAVVFVEIDGAGHGINVERKHEVNRQIVRFLSEALELQGLHDPDYAVRFRTAMQFVESKEEGLDDRLAGVLRQRRFPDSPMSQVALEFVRWKRSGEALPAGRPREGGRPNILLISIDTLRADHLGCYGYDRPTSPNIDSLARKGVLFEDAFSPASWTLPGHMSIFTSLYPSFHKLTHNAMLGNLRLDSSERTITELLRGLGYRTASFVTHPFLAAAWGFDRGFDLYVRKETGLANAAEQTERALRWLEWHLYHERRGLEPSGFFLFLHYIDPHETYKAPQPFRDRYTGSYEGQLRPDDHLVTVFLENDFESQADYQYTLALYDGEISYVDHEIGRLLRSLDDLGLLDSTVIVLTSDHGEEFKEHGGMGHATTVYAEQLHVPLIISYPAGIAAGQRVSSQASLVDIYPTLLGLIGEEIPVEAQGIDLGRFLGKNTSNGRVVKPQRAAVPPVQFAELGPLARSQEPPFYKRAIRANKYKLILNYGARGQPTKELFDITTDPEEQRNLYPSIGKNASIRDLERQLMDFIKEGTAYNPEARNRNQIKVDEQIQEQLRALGYID